MAYRNCPICNQPFYGRAELKAHVVSAHGYDSSVHQHFEDEPDDGALDLAILANATMWPESTPTPSEPEPPPLEAGGGDFGGAGASTDFTSTDTPDTSDVSPISDGSGPGEM